MAIPAINETGFRFSRWLKQEVSSARIRGKARHEKSAITQPTTFLDAKSKGERLMSILNTQRFIDALVEKFQSASASVLDYLEVNSGDLHREVGGYPGKHHRMPACCQAMYKVMAAGDTIVASPPKGKGASLTIRYRLPRPK